MPTTHTVSSLQKGKTRLSPELPVTFKLHAPSAKEVRLAGDFTNWQHAARPLKRNPDGTWQTEIRLGPGRHQYRFLVDGQWHDDPACTEREKNPFGTTNNVIVVK